LPELGPERIHQRCEHVERNDLDEAKGLGEEVLWGLVRRGYWPGGSSSR
jgi:hypothetical protein